jgi:hypothetical protein
VARFFPAPTIRFAGQAIWTAFKNRTGAMVYNYWPSTNALGISAQQLVRADIVPSEDFQPGKLTKLAWPGLRDVRGVCVCLFVCVFAIVRKRRQRGH